jgi:hypothetical protein
MVNWFVPSITRASMVNWFMPSITRASMADWFVLSMRPASMVNWFVPSITSEHCRLVRAEYDASEHGQLVRAEYAESEHGQLVRFLYLEAQRERRRVVAGEGMLALANFPWHFTTNQIAEMLMTAPRVELLEACLLCRTHKPWVVCTYGKVNGSPLKASIGSQDVSLLLQTIPSLCGTRMKLFSQITLARTANDSTKDW